MVERMDMGTFMDWRRMYHFSPWGEVRGDLRMAISCALTANVNRDTKKRSRPYVPKDFLEMTPSGRALAAAKGSTAGGPVGRSSMPQEYQPTTPEQFAIMSSSLRATFGNQPVQNSLTTRKRLEHVVT